MVAGSARVTGGARRARVGACVWACVCELGLCAAATMAAHQVSSPTAPGQCSAHASRWLRVCGLSSCTPRRHRASTSAQVAPAYTVKDIDELNSLAPPSAAPQQHAVPSAVTTGAVAAAPVW